MKTKQLFIKMTTAAMFAAAMFFGASAAFAQVKIGTNPTVINPANNLEVESADPLKKVSIDKTTGKVTIADGSQGVNKVLTSDAAGVATWQLVGTQNIAQLPKGSISGASVSSPFVNGTGQSLAYSTLNFAQNGVTKVGNGIKVPTAGYYLITASTNFFNSSTCAGASYASVSTTVHVNGVATGPGADDKTGPRYYDNFASTVSGLLYLNANDVVTLMAYNSFSLTAESGCTTTIAGGNLQLSYLP